MHHVFQQSYQGGAKPDSLRREEAHDGGGRVMCLREEARDCDGDVTIQARPEEIWPWLVQMGVTRAGWYSYDLLDNLGRHSAEHILPQWQHRAVGDLIPFSPDGKAGMWVKALEPQQWMIWSDKKGDSTWYWGLFPQDESHTRLITRVRLAYRWTKPSILVSLLTEFTDIVMMRKCMLSIKQRVERGSVPAEACRNNRK